MLREQANPPDIPEVSKAAALVPSGYLGTRVAPAKNKGKCVYFQADVGRMEG